MKMMVEKDSATELFRNYSIEKDSIENKLRKGISDKKRETRLKKRRDRLEKRLIPKVISRIKDQKR